MKITLNLNGCENAAQIHAYLQSALAFPDYYGKNLDALYDVLSTWDRSARFVLKLPAAPAGDLAAYLPRLVRVFRDAAGENRRISVSING